jgi:hypothetical protein
MSVRDWFLAPPPPAAAAPAPERWVTPADAIAVRGPTCAAVLGREGDAEPFAAALALALRRPAGARAATVVVVGAAAAETPAGTRAARRLVARLSAHGLEASEKGRLCWVALTASDVHAARRAARVGAPAVLAVTAPLTAALEAAIAEQDLAVIVTADAEGPLARLAAAGLTAAHGPVLIARPLPRGLGRTLTRAGLRSSRPARELVAGALRESHA